MTTESSQLAQPRRTIREWLQTDEFKREIGRALPKHLPPDYFIRVALTATLKTPGLLECSRESLFRCLFELSQAGLAPDNRRAYLVPFGKEATVIIGYQGIAELVRRSGDVGKIEAHEVCERDQFDFRFGTHGMLDHKPVLHDRGAIVAAYSFVTLKGGEETFDVMGIEDIQRIRRRSKTPDSGPWKTDFAEMAKKTVFRRHSKLLPLSAETREWIERDDETYEPATEQERFGFAKPAQVVPGAEAAEPSKRRGRPKAAPPVEAELEKANQYPDDGTMSPSGDSTPPVPAGEQSPTIFAEILARLAREGATAESFLEVLHSVNMIGPDVKQLEDVPVQTLQMCLDPDRWDDVRAHLAERKK